MAKKTLCSLLLATLLSVSAYSQSFQNIVNSLGVYHPTPEVYNGSGLSCADFNNDGWDDLTVCTYNSPVKFYLNINGESFQDTVLIDYQADTKAALWVDLDNDNDLDFIISAFLGYTKVYRNDGDLDLVDVTETSGMPQSLNAMSYGLSAGDVNRDGWVDIYVCNYNWPSGQTNWLLMNNGDFTFTNVSASSPANDGNRRSFQGAFIDLEHDLWPDLYVINDKNTKNSLYSNQQGVFVDVSVATNTDLYMESMCNSWCDYDHDGDLDVYITNGPIGNAFLRNDNGVFVDIAPELDMMVESLCWGAIWFDFNGDSWEDLYVCDIFPYLTDHNICFINNGDGTFTELTAQGMQGDNFSSYACAYMDVDNNMAPDLVVINTFDQNVSIWRNSNTSYNALGLELLNQQGIAGGIGSWVHVYANNTVQNRYITCGDNYLSQNSHKQFFGLGSEVTADSVIVQWPSGWVDKYYDLPKDSLITLHEGQTAQVNLLSENVVLCPGDSALVQFASPLPPTWSDGFIGYSRWVNQSGQYAAALEWSPGQWVFSDTMQVIVQDSIFPSLIINPILCFGQNNASILLDSTSCMGCSLIAADDYLNLGPGNYLTTVMDSIGCIVQIQGAVSEPSELVGTIVSTVDAFNGLGGSITIDVEGGSPPYTFAWSDGSSNQDLLNTGAGNYQCTVSDANGCEIILNSSLIDLQVYDIQFSPQIYWQNHALHIRSAGKLTLYNAMGQLVLEKHVSGADQVELSNIACGIYFYTFHPRFVESLMENGRFYLD